MNHSIAKHHAAVNIARFERRWNRAKGYSTNDKLKTATKRFHKATRLAAKKLCTVEVGNPRPAPVRMGVYHA